MAMGSTRSTTDVLITDNSNKGFQRSFRSLLINTLTNCHLSRLNTRSLKNTNFRDLIVLKTQHVHEFVIYFRFVIITILALHFCFFVHTNSSKAHTLKYKYLLKVLILSNVNKVKTTVDKLMVKSITLIDT